MGVSLTTAHVGIGEFSGFPSEGFGVLDSISRTPAGPRATAEKNRHPRG